MSVKIRLQLMGKRNARTFRVVAIDESKKRNADVIENLGFVDPSTKPAKVAIKKERVDAWVKTGAQMTDGVKKFLENA